MKFELVEGGTAIRISGFDNIKSPLGVRTEVALSLRIDPAVFYLTRNGKLLPEDHECMEELRCPITAIPRVVGGKGGFGSMLRAIGAQIEKTTNRDACRDLSGRRLRDINEEQRLKRWFAKQGEREEERQELRRQKLERMRKICEGPPLPKTEDREYNQQRADMSEAVFEAVDIGFEVTTSSFSKPDTSVASTSASATVTSSSKDLHDEDAAPQPSTSTSNPLVLEKLEQEKPEKKIKKTMFDEDLDSDISSSDEETPIKKIKIA